MNILEEVTKSVWREVGKDALKRGVGTLVGESIKAAVEVVKKRRIRRDQWEFQQWKKEQGAETKDDAEKDEKSSDAEEADESKEAQEVAE